MAEGGPMPVRLCRFRITLTVVVLVMCGGCAKGVSPTGGGAPPGAASSPSAATSSTAPPGSAAQAGRASSGGGNGSGNSGSGNSGSGNSGSGNSGSGGAQGAPLHIPAIILDQGVDLQTEYNKVVSDVTSECGGTMCVSVSTAGTGLECDFTVTANGVTQTDPSPATDSQGNQIDIVPRGASIVINGNADGSSDNCPSDNSGPSGGGSPGDQSSPSS